MRQNKDTQALSDIYEMIWIDTALAWDQALAAIEQHQSPRLTYNSAKAQVLVYIICGIANRQHAVVQEAKRIKEYFQKNNHHSDAATITLWMIRWSINSGQHDEAMLLDKEYEEKYAPTASAADLVGRMLATGNYHMMRDLNKANQVELALRAESILRAQPADTAYYRIKLSNVLQYKAEALSHTGDMIAAGRAIDEAVALADVPGTSPYYSFICYYFKGNVAAINGENEEALKSYYVLADRFAGQSFYERLLMYVYIQIFKQLNEMWAKAPGTDKPALVAGQEKYLALAQGLLHAQKRPYIVSYLELTEARLMRVKREYSTAIRLLSRVLRYFESIKYSNHVVDVWEEAYLNYRDRANMTQQPADYQRAMRTLVKVNNLNHRYNQAQGKEKMDALTNKYELQQKELNEKLLHQKMEAMNKEMQMTALNLQEKVTVLDELKGYVRSLKQKGKETNLLINTIAQKIDAVIITEQDKSTLQQKINETNSDFMTILSESYPDLSMLEVRMCALLKTGMTNKELSKLYGQGEKSYEQHRYRIKKKMGLGKDEKLVRVLNQLVK